MSGFFIGIDVGGTNLKAGLTDETGRLLAAARRPLDFRGAETFAADLADLAAEVLSAVGAAPRDAESVGIGLPGAVSGGEVLYTTNIPLERTDLAALFRRRLDLPVLLGNDADCAAVGEYFQGAGRGLRDFVVLTLGTGLGAGIILDGRLRGGESSSEAGHMVLHAGGEPCPCGRRGCWEQYASATALIRRTEAAMAAHPESALCRLAEEAGGVDGRTPFLAAEAGDETALAVCRAYVEELAGARPVSSTSSGRRRWPSAEVWPGRRSICCWSPCAAGSGRCASPATAGGPPASSGRSWATPPASSVRPCWAG